MAADLSIIAASVRLGFWVKVTVSVRAGVAVSFPSQGCSTSLSDAAAPVVRQLEARASFAGPTTST